MDGLSDRFVREDEDDITVDSTFNEVMNHFTVSEWGWEEEDLKKVLRRKWEEMLWKAIVYWQLQNPPGDINWQICDTGEILLLISRLNSKLFLIEKLCKVELAPHTNSLFVPFSFSVLLSLSFSFPLQLIWHPLQYDAQAWL